MSFATTVLDLGGGPSEFRIAIEGCPLEFCTAHTMATVIGDGSNEDDGNTSGVRRVGGLRREGLSFTESAYLPGADYRATLGSVTIEDIDESVAWNTRAACSVFSKVPREVAFLLASVDHVETTWLVNSTLGFEVGTVYHADTEAFRVDAVDVESNTIEVTRSMYRTISQSHYVAHTSAIGDVTQACAIFDAPPTYRRRRVWIYGHGVNAETQEVDAGGLIARGVVGGAPSLDNAMTWSFPLASTISLLESDIGIREDATAIRGIYYPGATPYIINVSRQNGESIYSTFDSRITVMMIGFWETQDAWCEELTAKLNAEALDLGWTETFSARPEGSGWELYVRTADTGSEVYLSAEGGSVIDGVFTPMGGLVIEDGLIRQPTVEANTEYRFPWIQPTDERLGWNPPIAGVRGVPRSASFLWLTRARGTFEELAAYPWHRFYVGNVAGLAPGTVLRCDMPETDTRGAFAWEAIINDVDADAGSLTWDPDTVRRTAVDSSDSIGVGALWTEVTPASLPTLTLGGLAFGNGNHVGEMIRGVCDAARERGNSGLVPFILATDFDSFDTIAAAVREASAGRSWLLHRHWLFTKPVRFLDVVKHELRLLGAYLTTTVTGKITIRPLTESFDRFHTIGNEDVFTDESFGELVVEPDGLVTGLTVRTGYNSREDKHEGTDIEVTALGALFYQRKRLALDVAPKSTANGSEPTPFEIFGHLYGSIAFWSRHRMQVRAEVSLKHYDALIGDCVFITLPQVPFDGERAIDGGGGGIVEQRGLVVGREWRFDEPSVTLTLVFMGREVTGYTPAGRVLSQTGADTTWTVTLAAAEYGPGFDTRDASLFEVGFKVRLVEYDVDVPTIVTGTVVGVSVDDVEIELDATWTPGSSTWNLVFDQSTTIGATSEQAAYAFVARDDMRVHYVAGTKLARMFAP